MPKASKFAYRSKNAWIMYDPKFLRKAIWYPEIKEGGLIKTLEPFYKLGLEKDAPGDKAGAIELFYSPVDYYTCCLIIFGERAAGCIMKLMFHGPRLFHQMPRYGKMPKKYLGKLILYHQIVCEMKDADLVEQTLRLIFSKFELRNMFDYYVKKQEFPEQNIVLFGMNYGVYSHVLMAPEIFAAKTGFLKNLKHERKPSKEILLGRAFNPETYCDPKTNLYHPDALSKEQLIRWSSVV